MRSPVMRRVFPWGQWLLWDRRQLQVRYARSQRSRFTPKGLERLAINGDLTDRIWWIALTFRARTAMWCALAHCFTRWKEITTWWYETVALPRTPRLQV